MERREVTFLRGKNGDSRGDIQEDDWGHTLRHTKEGAGGDPGEGFEVAEGTEGTFSGLGMGTVLGTEGTSRGETGDCRVSSEGRAGWTCQGVAGTARGHKPGGMRDSVGVGTMSQWREDRGNVPGRCWGPWHRLGTLELGTPSLGVPTCALAQLWG